MSTAPQPEHLSFDEADRRLGGALSEAFRASYETVLFFAGALELEGDFLPAVQHLAAGPFDLVAVAGDLKVSGRIALYDPAPGLFVQGDTSAATLEGGDCEIAIQDGAFTCFVYGEGSDGVLQTGSVETPWVINSNHDLRVLAERGAKWIDLHGDDPAYDYGTEDLQRCFVPWVRGKDDHASELDLGAFRERLLANKMVLVPRKEGKKGTLLAAIAEARRSRAPVLEIEKKEIYPFPPEILSMRWLERLVLRECGFCRLPPEIGQLVELEELTLAQCEVAVLPAEVGNLRKLRKLDVSRNKPLTKDASDKYVQTPIRLPSTLGELEALEELDLTRLSLMEEGPEEPPRTSVYELPESAGQLRSLRVLRADETNLALPRSAWGLPALEELSLSGGSCGHLLEFPAWATSFPRLRSLDVGDNYFRAIPDLSPLSNLEELDLGCSLGLLDRLPELSVLPRLRVLNLDGFTNRTTVAAPPLELLRPLFRMDLPQLEELCISRWGRKGSEEVIPPEAIAGLGRFRRLRRLDLSFNRLTRLPEDFYSLPALEEIDVRHVPLEPAEAERLRRAYPRAKINDSD